MCRLPSNLTRWSLPKNFALTLSSTQATITSKSHRPVSEQLARTLYSTSFRIVCMTHWAICRKFAKNSTSNSMGAKISHLECMASTINKVINSLISPAGLKIVHSASTTPMSEMRREDPVKSNSTRSAQAVTKLHLMKPATWKKATKRSDSNTDEASLNI